MQPNVLTNKKFVVCHPESHVMCDGWLYKFPGLQATKQVWAHRLGCWDSWIFNFMGGKPPLKQGAKSSVASCG